MKVLYFHQHFSTRAGAAGTRSYEMAKRLLARGHEVTVVCASNTTGQSGIQTEFVNGRREGVVDGIRVIEYQLSYSNRLSFQRRIVVFAKYAVRSTMLALKEDYDLLFATSAPLTAAIPGIAMKIFRLKKRPFVFEIRDPWPEAPKAMGVIKNPIVLGLIGLLETMAYRAADAYIALSPGMIETFTEKKVPRELVAMVPNGSDNECVFPTDSRNFELPGIENGDFVAAFTGAHGFANGLDKLIDAASILKARGLDRLRIVLIGDGAKKPSIQKRVEAEGLSQIVRFFDPIPKNKLQALMVEADLGLMILDNIHTFYYRSSPNKFFDYLSYGLPVLVNHPGWVKDLVEEYQCGVYADPDKSDALADAIEQMYKLDSSERLAMGKRSRALAESQFDRRDLSNRFVDHLESAYASWNK